MKALTNKLKSLKVPNLKDGDSSVDDGCAGVSGGMNGVCDGVCDAVCDGEGSCKVE